MGAGSSGSYSGTSYLKAIATAYYALPGPDGS